MSDYITKSAQKALRREFIETYIREKMNPLLQFKDIFPFVDLKGSSTFKSYEDDTSAEDDIQNGVMSEPSRLTELSDLPLINITSIQSRIGDTYKFGYALQFSKESLERENGFIDEMMRAYDRATYGMARQINLDIFNKMDSVAKAAPIDLNDGTWDSSNEIRDDIIDMKHSFEDVVGYDYSLTNLYANSLNYREVEKYYNAIDSFNPSSVEGVNLTNCKTLVEEGTVYGIDESIKPITVYYNVDRDFSTVENGLVNVDIYDQQGYPHFKVIELWCEMGIASKVPEAILKQTGV